MSGSGHQPEIKPGGTTTLREHLETTMQFLPRLDARRHRVHENFARKTGRSTNDDVFLRQAKSRAKAPKHQSTTAPKHQRQKHHFTAIREDAGLYCGSRLRKGEVFAHVGRNQNLKDLKDQSTYLSQFPPYSATALYTAGSSRSFTAIRTDAGLCCGSHLRKGEVFAYLGSIHNLNDLRT